MFLLEVTWWSHNVLTNLIVGGVLERHPDLQFVFTEQGTAWVPDFLGSLDYFFDRMRNAVGLAGTRVGPARRREDVAAAERVLGAPVPRRRELHPPVRGADPRAGRRRPHHVGERLPAQGVEPPVLQEAIRLSFAGVDPAEVQMMLGGNAAALYGFDLDALRLRSAAGSGPSSGRSPGRCRRPTSRKARRSARRSRIPRSPCSDTPDPRGSRMSVDIRSRVDGEVEAVEPATVLRGGAAGRVRAAARSARARRWREFAPATARCSRSTVTRGRSPTTTAPCACARGRADDAATVLRLSAAQLERSRHRSGHRGRHADQRLARPTRRALRRAARLVARCSAARSTPVRRTYRARSTSSTPTARRSRSTAASPPTRRWPRWATSSSACRLPPHHGRVRRGRDGRGVARHGRRRAHVLAWRRPVVVGANRAGDDLLVRMQYFDEVSPAVERLVGRRAACSASPDSPATTTCSAA